MPARAKPAREREPRGSLTSDGRGVLEITLGSAGYAISLVLIGRGAWLLGQRDKLARECNDTTGDSGAPTCGVQDPVRAANTSAGLSFAFAVPLMVGASLLMARGVRLEQTFRRGQRIALSPAAWTTGAGAQLDVRF